MQRVSRPSLRGARLLVLVLVALVVTAAVAASPAAALTTTSLTLTPQSATVKWGTKGILNGRLSTTENPPVLLDGQLVDVKYSISSQGPWTTVEPPITNTAEPYTTGAYTFDWTAARNYYWMMSYAGTGDWLGTDSNVVLVKVTPALGKPSCPRSVKAGKRFTVSGTLKPRFPAGSKTVEVKAQRYVSGKWRGYKRYTATNVDSGSYSKYSVRIKITTKGKYRFYATTVNTSTLAAGKSVYSRTLRVL